MNKLIWCCVSGWEGGYFDGTDVDFFHCEDFLGGCVLDSVASSRGPSAYLRFDSVFLVELAFAFLLHFSITLYYL